MTYTIVISNMWCVLSLGLFIVFAMALGVIDSHVNWIPSFKPHWYEQAEYCCNHKLSIRDEDKHTYDKQLLKECTSIVEHNNTSPYSTCEPDLCFAIKKGYATANGEINRETLEILLGVELQENLLTLQKILQDCVYGDLFKYPIDLCPMKKLNMCISVHIEQEVLRGCTDWKDNFYCLRMRLQNGRNVKHYLPETSFRSDIGQVLPPKIDVHVPDSIDMLMQRKTH